MNTALHSRRYNLKKRGLTIEDYDWLSMVQNHACALCERPSSSGRRLAVDHCHKTNNVRGLLCSKCNVALGLLEDDIERLYRVIEYIRRGLHGTPFDRYDVRYLPYEKRKTGERALRQKAYRHRVRSK